MKIGSSQIKSRVHQAKVLEKSLTKGTRPRYMELHGPKLLQVELRGQVGTGRK